MKLLNIKLWLILLERLFLAIYPAELVLIPFSIKSLKQLRASAILHLLFIFLLVDVGIRTLLFFSAVPFSQRYFFPFAVTVSILVVAGFNPLVDFISKKVIRKTSEAAKFTLAAVLIFTIGLSYSLKALSPRKDKPWLQMIPATIKQLTPPNSTPVIISNELDERFGYYADSHEMYRVHPDKKWLLMKRKKIKEDNDWAPFDQKKGISNLAEKINEMGSNRVFIILKVEKNGTSDADKELSENLPDIFLAGTFTDRKKRVFKLYTIKKTK